MKTLTRRRGRLTPQQQARIRIAAARAAFEAKRLVTPADAAIEAERYHRCLEGGG